MDDTHGPPILRPTYRLDLTWPQLCAMRSLVAEHLLCPTRADVYIDVVSDTETTHEDLLGLLLSVPAVEPPRPSAEFGQEGDR